MKKLMFSIIIVFTQFGSIANAQLDSHCYPPIGVSKDPKCWGNSQIESHISISTELLEVVEFHPKETSNSNIGTCILKASSLFWIELFAEKQYDEKNLKVDSCNSNRFLKYQDKNLIKAKITYHCNSSRCHSKLGCHVKCDPIEIKL